MVNCIKGDYVEEIKCLPEKQTHKFALQSIEKNCRIKKFYKGML